MMALVWERASMWLSKTEGLRGITNDVTYMKLSGRVSFVHSLTCLSTQFWSVQTFLERRNRRTIINGGRWLPSSPSVWSNNAAEVTSRGNKLVLTQTNSIYIATCFDDDTLFILFHFFKLDTSRCWRQNAFTTRTLKDIHFRRRLC